MARWQPPHPAALIHPPRTCPTGRPRFRTRDLAQASVPVSVHIPHETELCGSCAGWHVAWPAR